MSDAPIKIIQISDIHLFADKNRELLGVKTEESFQAVVDLIKAQDNDMDFILLSGDLTQDGTHEAYLRVVNMLKSFNVPIYCVPGNHDDSKIMGHVYPRETVSNHRHIILKNWHLILLDSQKPGSVEGYLDQSQLKYLQHCLQTYPEHQAIVVMHHQPLPVGCEWLDKLGVTNAEELWDILSRYPNVHTILFGHVHQTSEQEKNGIKCYSLPSTCIQFKCHQDNFGLDEIPPGYRWIKLYDDKRIETGIKRVSKYIGTFDPNAKGY